MGAGTSDPEMPTGGMQVTPVLVGLWPLAHPLWGTCAGVNWDSGQPTRPSAGDRGQPCFPQGRGDGARGAGAAPWAVAGALPGLCQYLPFFLALFFSKTVNTPGLRFTLQGEKVGQGSWIPNNVALKGVQVSPLTVAGAPRVRGENPTKQAGAGTAGPRVPSPSALSRGLPHRPEPAPSFPSSSSRRVGFSAPSEGKLVWLKCANIHLSPLR